MKNTGGESGTYKVEMKVNGEVTASKDVTVAGGASQNVSFSFIGPENLGEYKITIDENSFILIVDELL